MSASSVRESPVISQSIHTIRSPVDRFVDPAGLVTGLTLSREPTPTPDNPQAACGLRLE